ncbi:type 2 lanthipeptide synthetase LanM family protein [Cytobacillus massiliigabonensis]|uniref:type 2 lanthipeptide synthetase LanM family protein n=1 Tax=Cytobacillus massiliigabonensis TaxID=1871011 RepID=UPI0015E0BC47|nr:type 2 lanthipeptide synthetase LanM family protein [Cytobacillus massiliigabonensis]
MKVDNKIKIDSARAIKALWINERSIILNGNKELKNNDLLINIEKWRKRKNIVSDETFKIKLGYEKYTEREFDYLIGDLIEKDKNLLIKFVENSDWFNVLEESFDLLDSDQDNNLAVQNWGPSVKPFILWCNQKLTSLFDSKHPDFFINKVEIIHKLIETVGTELINLLSRSAVLELHIAKLEGKLKGDTPEDRFNSFINHQFVNKKNLVEFYEEYIVLTRLLATKSLYFVNNITEAVNHFIEDYSYLLCEMDLDNARVLEINPGMGDTHQKGHTVVSFKLDNNKMLFYKPKNLLIAVSYNNLINWINTKNEILDMKIYKSLCRDTYTWEQSVIKQNCTHFSQIRDFYERFGQLIGIMYCLRGGDFHFENLIASGEYPCVIDLETILQHVPPMNFQDLATAKAKNEFLNSVMWLGLLPNKIYSDINDNVGIDMSALNGKEQKVPYKVLQPHNNYTDDMKFDYAEFFLSNKENLPLLNGEAVSYKDFKDVIYKGFKNACKFFIDHKEEILNNKSLLPSFKNHRIRVILRATNRYAMMLHEGTHPDYLRDALDREKLLENLWSYTFPNKHVISHEVKDMLEGDIPIFFTEPDSKNLIDSSGNVIPNFFEESSYNLVVERIESLTIQKIEQQLSWIKVSLGDYDYSNAKNTKPYDTYNQTSFTGLNSDELITEACKIGDYLLDIAFVSNDKKTLTWLDVVINRSNIYSIDTLPTDFYDGIGGMILFYNNLFNVTKLEKYKKAYQKILKTFNSMPDMGVISSHYGNLSILQTLCRIPNNNDEEITQLINKYLNILEEKYEDSVLFDYLNGDAGVINSLLYLYENYYKKDNKKLLRLIEKISDKLIEKLDKISPESIIGGMAHGASGLSLILFKLNHLIPKVSYYNKAILLLELDRSYFDSGEEAWKEVNRRSYLHQWCHGSTGIGISRALISNYYSDKYIKEEIEIAVNNLLMSGFKLEDSLCHGNMGDIEFFLTLAILFDRKEAKEHALKILHQMLQEKRTNGQFHIRHTEGFIGIGLFTGLAGVGYEMLRMAEPDLVPSVLY